MCLIKPSVVPAVFGCVAVGDASVITMGTDGSITAMGAGTTTVTATSTSNPSAFAGVSVTVIRGSAPVLTSFTITGAVANLYNGVTGILTVGADGTVTADATGSSGGGYCGTISAAISGAGAADFGLSHGITGVSFAKGTTGKVVLDTKPKGITHPSSVHSIVEVTAPSFEGPAEIQFAVPVSMLRDQGLGVNDVSLHHYVNGECGFLR